MGSSRRILRFILKLRTHTSRAGGRSMGDTLRECRPKPQRRRSIHQARSSTLEVRGTGRAQRRQTPQKSPYRRGSAATSALSSADYSLLRTCPVSALIRTWSALNTRSGCPSPRARVFGPAHGIDGFWVCLRAAQLSTAANPAKGPPVAPCIIISSQTAVVRDSQHSRATVHVHRFHCVCQRLILILVDQHGAFRVVHLNHCGATA